MIAEVLVPDRGHRGGVGAVEEVGGDLHDVAPVRACRRQDGSDVLVHLACLDGHITLTDQVAVLVPGHLPCDVERVTGAERVYIEEFEIGAWYGMVIFWRDAERGVPMEKHLALAVFAIVAVVMLPSYVLASATASLADIIITDVRDSGTEKTTFIDQPAKIYVQFRLVDAPAGTRVRCLWIAQDAQSAPPNYKIDDVSMRMGGLVNRGTCSLSKPNRGWPPGDYRVEIYLEDRLAHTARFKVAAAPAAVASAPAVPAGERIGPVIFDSRIANNRAVSPSTRFNKGVRQVYAFFEFRGLQAGDRVDGVWYQGNNEILRQSRTVAQILGTREVAPTGRLWFSVRWPRGAEAGSYSFVVHVNGQVTRTTTFEVE